MSDFYLRFADEAEAIAALPEFRVEDEAGSVIWATHSAIGDLDVIGEIWRDDVKLNGWHLNIRGLEQPEWAGYLVYPTSLSRNWA